MAMSFWINQLQFTAGVSIDLKKDSIVVFVGPNNSGKSRVLREIDQKIKSPAAGNAVIIAEAHVSVEGSEEEFLQSIQSRRSGNNYRFYRNDNTSIDQNLLRSSWRNLVDKKSTGAHSVGEFLASSITTASRLNLVDPVENIDAFSQLSKHPIHELKHFKEKEDFFSRYFKLAFGEEVVVNHGYGTKIALHVGTRPEVTAENDRVSLEYQKSLRKLPFLHAQGDGMKSFAGVFLNLFVQDFMVNIIDEPEAFLHPPQAGLLGQMISQSLSKEKQVFVATHSEHFLKGLLDGAADRLIIVRIERDDTVNHIKVLENSKILSVWNDTLLRHSNVLDGLFHKKVVVAESDSDCRFFNAICGAIVEREVLQSPDILFVASGGKERFPTIIKALKALEVPMTIIGDFDLYHNENPLKKIYEELEGNWNDIKNDFFKVKKVIDEKLPELKSADLKREIDNIFKSFDESVIPDYKISEIQTALKKASPWRQAKDSGKAYLPAGEAILAFNRVQVKLEEKGVVILESGEIESFDPTIGGHGPKWVNEVLKKDIYSSPDLDNAKRFAKEKILKL
ncbi:AAA family ATPase [Sphingobacterium siyangense]|uniref:ATP-dependent nuclease n=1 Tax=Sphingobacterium siyangense TaxID=459529 RepID=UPI002FD91850